LDRPISWKLLYHNFIADQKQIWSFPARLMQGQDWTPTAAVLGTTAGLVLLDPTEAGYFHHNADISWVQQHLYGQRHGEQHWCGSGLVVCHRPDPQRLAYATNGIACG
jgi:hypothetical protein